MGQAGTEHRMQHAIAAKMRHGTVEQQKLGADTVFRHQGVDVAFNHPQPLFEVDCGGRIVQQTAQA